MMSNRTGWTAVELAVSLSITALLCALLLPALGAVRESNRRTVCLSRLRELGRALQAYQSVHRKFPAAQRATQTEPLGSLDFHAPHVDILPFVDKTHLSRQINRRKPRTYLADPSELPLADVSIETFVCPSDGGRLGTNYRFCTGPGPYAASSPLSPGGDLGPFTALIPWGPADFPDGLSNTVALSEKQKSNSDGLHFGHGDSWYTGMTNLWGLQPNVDEVVDVCIQSPATPSHFHARAGHTWLLSTFHYTWYNHTTTPNSNAADCSVQPAPSSAFTPPGGGIFQATSAHSDGVNCVMMDGSGRFVNDNIALDVWRGYSTRSGGL